MSFSLVLICLIAIGMPSSIGEEMVDMDRICNEDKDYVDASVMFYRSYYVIIDRVYYEFDIEGYKSDGVQEIALREYDRSWRGQGPDKPVQTGRYLGGFFHYDVPIEILFANQTVDKRLEPIYDFPTWRDLDISIERPEDYYNSYNYSYYMSSMQFVVFKDEHTFQNKYHVKLMEDHDGLIEIPDSNVFHDIPSRGILQRLLPLGEDLPPDLLSLPMAFSYETLTLYVIINKKDSPRLYYNHLMKNQTKERGGQKWHSIDIPKGFRYKAFIPTFVGNLGTGDLNEFVTFVFSYQVIAEPFRDIKVDKNRGPSFLFKLVIDSTGNPSLVQEKGKSGMSVFKCKFRPTSSTVLYAVFGSIIGILLLILMIVACFVSINYLSGKDRMIIVRRTRDSTKTLSRSSSHKRGISLQQKDSEQFSEADKRSENE